MSDLLASETHDFFFLTGFLLFFFVLGHCCKCHTINCLSMYGASAVVFLPSIQQLARVTHVLWEWIFLFQHVVFHVFDYFSIFLSISHVHKQYRIEFFCHFFFCLLQLLGCQIHYAFSLEYCPCALLGLSNGETQLLAHLSHRCELVSEVLHQLPSFISHPKQADYRHDLIMDSV